MSDSTPQGLYVHIPFCHRRCGYCDFVTFTGREAQQGPYIRALVNELALLSRRWAPRPLDTIFFGGGTPSELSADQVEEVVRAIRTAFSLLPGAEITVEGNPESLTGEALDSWKRAGATRLSIGLQAFDDRLLRAMDRRHTVEDFVRAFRAARAAGFENLSVDLIYGFPDQTLEDWKETLRATVALGPEHLSLYALAIEPHTPFAERGVSVDADRQADQYAWARSWLPEQGYRQYEISNFSRPGLECRHNLRYWRQLDYLAAGVGAVGCVGGLRWQNDKNLSSYFEAVREGRLPWLSEEHLDDRTRRFERLMLGLRLREGLEWGEEPEPAWRESRSRLADEGLLEEIGPGRWRVADRAVPLTNQVLLPFL